jgi:Uma2 family endonuclease
MASVSAVLRAYAREHKLGVVLAGDPGVILRRNPDRVRGPDVCFIRQERLAPGGIPRGYLETVPDLIVEIISPGDTATEVEAKMEEWLRAGARLAWAMYPETRSILAYRSLTDIQVYSETELIDAAPVLPDFRVRVADLFS